MLRHYTVYLKGNPGPVEVSAEVMARDETTIVFKVGRSEVAWFVKE